jgi:hypothetical protein
LAGVPGIRVIGIGTVWVWVGEDDCDDWDRLKAGPGSFRWGYQSCILRMWSLQYILDNRMFASCLLHVRLPATSRSHLTLPSNTEYRSPEPKQQLSFYNSRNAVSEIPFFCWDTLGQIGMPIWKITMYNSGMGMKYRVRYTFGWLDRVLNRQ